MNEPKLTPTTTTPTDVTTSPFRCLTGSVISGGLAYAAYSLMIAIATTFAAKPIHTDNEIVFKIASAVRTLVVGVVALGAGVFGLVAVGLLALAGQLLLQQLTKAKNS
jgi:hypothetical protein